MSVCVCVIGRGFRYRAVELPDLMFLGVVGHGEQEKVGRKFCTRSLKHQNAEFRLFSAKNGRFFVCSGPLRLKLASYGFLGPLNL